MKINVRQQGFTLVEMMIVVAILGILVSVGLPAYNRHVMRSRMQDAFVQLSNTRILMEQYFQDNRTYVNGGACGVAMPASEGFTITCAGDANSYDLTATGSGKTAGYTFTLDEQNNRTTTSYEGSSVTKSCWLSSGSEC